MVTVEAAMSQTANIPGLNPIDMHHFSLHCKVAMWPAQDCGLRSVTLYLHHRFHTERLIHIETQIMWVLRLHGKKSGLESRF